MKELQGKYNFAKVFTDNIEDEAISQVINMLSQEFMFNSKIRIMPDAHAGKGCVIGTTMTISDKVVPNLVGVDIGCGMLCVVLGELELDLSKIDQYIRKNIPNGFNINDQPKTDFKDRVNDIMCIRDIPKSPKEFNRAIGTLGGGNHFIEINESKNQKFLVIHSGSRNLGHQVASFYQKKAYEYHNGLNDEYENERLNLIKSYKEQGKKEEIQKSLQKLKMQYKKESNIDKEICYLEGRLMQNYLHDMKIVQEYAVENRDTMARRICKECIGLNYEDLTKFQTIHNYIDMETMILRKGAISAKNDEIVLIPINMRDGSLICKGKGNPDWNFSAPHGAGRIMSRTKAKEIVSIEEFEKSMYGIYTTSVSLSTLDESPMAYKPMQEIIDNIQDTVDVLEIIRPIYNFKSGE